MKEGSKRNGNPRHKECGCETGERNVRNARIRADHHCRSGKFIKVYQNGIKKWLSFHELSTRFGSGTLNVSILVASYRRVLFKYS